MTALKIGVIIGSHKKTSNSAKTARMIESMLKAYDSSVQFWSFDLGKTPLPMWDEDVWEGTEEWKKTWGPIASELQSCAGFIVISPEYSGMVPAALKNFFLLCSTKELGHKPGLIVAVSSGRGGSYPVVELRMSSYKNTRINWIPEHVIVRDADKVFNDAQASDEGDIIQRRNLAYGGKLLLTYAKAMFAVRESGVIDYKNHANGM
jgi:NAD(P)H-dependent FMN reductase